jgi:hypothetical protein
MMRTVLDQMNAEISLDSVSSPSDTVLWPTCTNKFARMKKSPALGGLLSSAKAMIRDRFENILQSILFVTSLTQTRETAENLKIFLSQFFGSKNRKCNDRLKN